MATQREQDMQERIIQVGNLCLSYGSVIYDLEASNVRQRVIEVLYAKKQEWEERHRQLQTQFITLFRNDEQDESHPYVDALMRKKEDSR